MSEEMVSKLFSETCYTVCYFSKTIGFDVKVSFASRPVSRLMRWYNKPDDRTKEFGEKAIQFHGITMN